MPHKTLMRARARRAAAGAATAALVAGAAVTPGTASAALTVTDGVYCDDPVGQAFAAFGDLAQYALAPGGDMESTMDGWTLSNASQVVGSNPYAITGTLGLNALTIRPGGSVTTPRICVDRTRETFRFVLRNVSHSKARLKVEAIFGRSGSKDLKVYGAGTVTGPVGLWQPSPILQNAASKAVPAGTTGDVSYRFTAEDGPIVLDDLHVDPYSRG